MKQFRDNLDKALADGALSLEDSGEGERLERLGSKLIRRPSSLALWNRSKPESLWDSADANFVVQQGWKYHRAPLTDWMVSIGDLSVKLLTQENGQIGIFPEHLTYFSDMSLTIEHLQKKVNRPLRVLNLFAYTGIASLWCALHECEVTHIELSKKVLSWAKENQELNPKLSGTIRFIPEDALTFLEREIKRKSSYDLIIADPPSFSRLSKSKTWDLEDVIIPLIRSMLAVLNTDGAIYLTSHHPALSPYSMENLIRDYTSSRTTELQFTRKDLLLSEREHSRKFTCGGLTIAQTY